MGRQTLIGMLVGAALTAMAPQAAAWTDKPVKMVVPAPAGGTMDIIARLLGAQLGADSGQPMVVDNKPGAGGAIAVQAMLASPADGQTLMVTASNVLTEIPHVMKTSFDPVKDVKPVAVVARSGMVLISSPGAQSKDLKELVGYVKANPGKLSFASYSAGTASHYAGMILNQKAGLDLQHVPFAGSPPALAQVMGGQILVMFDGMATSLPLIRQGKLKVYAVAGKARSTHLPQVPSTAELGYPELDFSNWIGVVMAGNVAPEVLGKVSEAVHKASASPKLRERLVGAGFEIDDAVSPAQLAQAVRAEYERNAAIVKAFNIKAGE